jgi:outer membrane protein OmpA-like peptidoglycan-associated protein
MTQPNGISKAMKKPYMGVNMSKRLLICATWVLLAFSGQAHAQQRGYAINLLEVSERGSEWFSADSLDLRGHVRPAIGIVGEWAYRPLTARNSGDDRVLSIIRNQFVMHAGASLVLVDRLRLGLDIPVQAFVDGRAATIGSATVAPPRDEASLGDIRLAADVRLFGEYGEVITGAIGVRVSLPTGNQDTYAGDGQVRISPQFLLAGEYDAFVWAARLGVTIRPNDERFANTYVDSNLSYSLAAGIRAVDRRLVVGPELFAHTSLTHDQFFKKRTTPTELMLGAHYLVSDGVRLGAGFGFGLTSGYGAPQHRGLLSLEWAPGIAGPALPALDRDADGVGDCNDACSFAAGPASSDPAQNGCPPPAADRDHDSVLDRDDACPDQAGVASSDPHTNGCPPPPPAPPDRDHDGILDAEDACPDEAGNPNTDRARNGCPAPKDSDGDGVLDTIDACPNDAGLPDADPKRNGCPKAYLLGNQIKILDQVKFKTNSAEIVAGHESEDVLLAVLAVFNAHSEIKLVQIEGHTDNTGGANRNRELSKNRAESVRVWLIKKGIDPTRLTATGFGPDRPLDSNETELGRKNNRRVEFQVPESPVVATPAAATPVVITPAPATPGVVTPGTPVLVAPAPKR